MIAQETFTRGGKSYTAHFGTDGSGIAALWIEAGFTESGQPIRYVPENLNVAFNQEGKAQPIFTKWRRQMLTLDGSVYESQAWPLHMTTNSKDMQDFTQMLWATISRFLLNGAIRGLTGEKAFGYNYQPLFNGQGARIPDSEYNTDALPSNDYDTHLVDGTPINPTPLTDDEA